MWQGLNHIQTLLRDEGLMFIMIYEDMGWKSGLWRAVKRTYCSGPVGRACVLGTFIPYYVIRGLLEDLWQLKSPLRRYREYKKQRGMSKFRDWIDWLGGYPYEHARPAEIVSFYQQKGLELIKCRVPEYVFLRPRAA
jgi:2-polyprenyl-6-hydroxyphenyl methylase/3-demethylubiquinone-9 3-methyltransferase